jgi:glutathione S-transferase
MAITIHFHPASQHSRRVRMAAIELGIDVTWQQVNLPATDEYRDINPMGKVPTLVDGNFVLWESNAVMAYLCEQKAGRFYGADAKARADVNRWLFWESAHFGPACIALTWERVMKPMMMKQQPNEALVANGVQSFARFAAVLDRHFETHEYVAGTLSIADFAVSTIAMYRGPAQFDTKPFPRLEAYLTRLESRDSWKQTQPQL